MGTPYPGMGMFGVKSLKPKYRIRRTTPPFWVLESRLFGTDDWRSDEWFLRRDKAVAEGVRLTLEGFEVDMSETV